MSIGQRALTALILAGLSTALVAGAPAPPSASRGLLVAAAASLGMVALDLQQRYRAGTGADVRFTFGGSNTLARQIVEGAGIDVFISADAAQMDVVERAGRLASGTRFDLLGNRLVIIVPAGTAATAAWPDHLTAPEVRRIAMGDPEAVPAGVYGRRWLETIRVWSGVAAKVVPLPSSPAALAAVREGRAQAGIVYVTDAGRQPGVSVAYHVPDDEAPVIAYPAAAVRGGREDEARRFLAFLRGPVAGRVFAAAGFRFLPR